VISKAGKYVRGILRPVVDVTRSSSVAAAALFGLVLEEYPS